MRQRGLGLIECLAAMPRILDSAPGKVMRAGPVEHGPLTRVLRRLASRRQSRHGSRFEDCFFSNGRASSSCRRVGDPKFRSKISESLVTFAGILGSLIQNNSCVLVIASSVDEPMKRHFVSISKAA